ncbi:MAG: hypothetical protein CM1200mP31_6350 [Candidatus Neomarinimicrobiota bacterium]|nr:MAG: hypothetical protein CM1200mP31_6350 [Candidatus Neomarinimicrobiota bacterium]
MAIITLQNRPTSSVFEKKESLRLDQNDLESLYEINSEDSFTEDLKFPITIRFESSDENYIHFSMIILNKNILSVIFVIKSNLTLLTNNGMEKVKQS